MKKNIKLFILSFVIQILFFGMMIIAIMDYQLEDFTGLVPLKNVIFDMFYFYGLSPLIMVGIIQFLSVLISYFYFKLHNIVKIKRYEYAVLNETENELSLRCTFIRVIILGFFAFSIGIIMEQLLKADFIVKTGDAETSLLIMVSTLFILPFLSLIIIPIYLLRDTGVMCSRKKTRKGQQHLPDIEGVYRTFFSYITGYIGIGTIVGIVVIIIKDIFLSASDPGLIIFIFLAPFAAVAISIPPMIFYEWQMTKLKDKLKTKLTSKEIKMVGSITEI
ncbi:MAG: hypothetical protein ACFE8B_08955 [Candidatus Hermodarchaeota archaeon]